MSLVVENINFTMKKKKLLNQISFTCKAGNMLALIGPNGAGKTTLLKSLTNIYKKDSGKVVLFGEDISNMSYEELSKKVAYMPQFNEVPHISVLEVLELGRYTFSKNKLKKEDRKILDDIINEFSLQSILSTNIANLSGGQRQKVFLASALVQEPKLLILDEPISHLDPKNQLDVLRVVKKTTKEKNIVTLIVLHDIQHALHYADELLMLKNTQVLYQLKKDEVKEEHLNKVFDIKSKLFKEEKHTFVFYKHSHDIK
ncbi:ABC transporter ATP-binding protein [Sulfurospirillum sp. 1307]|jgi:iron complex transport system ATP-binding protein